jgi:FkbM family methyltransferase
LWSKAWENFASAPLDVLGHGERTPSLTHEERHHRGQYLDALRPDHSRLFLKIAKKIFWHFLRPLANRLLAFEQELAKIVREHVLLRTELAALKNRREEPQRPADQVEEPQRLADQVVAMGTEVGSLRAQVRSLGSQLSQLVGRPALVAVNTRHGLLLAKPGDIISDVLIRGSAWDDHILELARRVARDRTGSAIDVGAHLGSITVPLASMFERVFSFEPNDFNFRLLRANAGLNGLDNVQLFNHALFSRPASLSLGRRPAQEVDVPLGEHGEFDGASAHNLGAYLFAEDGSGLFEHAARTLDSYELGDVAFIKIDAQGADGEVLMGALQTIQRCRPVVVFEWEDILATRFGVALEEVRRRLGSLGYEIDVLKAHNEKQVDYVARPIAGRA